MKEKAGWSGDESNPPDFRSFLRYEKDTGRFYWIKKLPYRNNVGKEAGWKDHSGGVTICFMQRQWHASRLAWYFVYGKFPALFIDHINGNRNDNRISNLREVTIRENNQNRKINRAGHLVGATKTQSNKWAAKIKINNKTVHLGTFSTEQEAANKYHEAYMELLK